MRFFALVFKAIEVGFGPFGLFFGLLFFFYALFTKKKKKWRDRSKIGETCLDTIKKKKMWVLLGLVVREIFY